MVQVEQHLDLEHQQVVELLEQMVKPEEPEVLEEALEEAFLEKVAGSTLMETMVVKTEIMDTQAGLVQIQQEKDKDHQQENSDHQAVHCTLVAAEAAEAVGMIITLEQVLEVLEEEQAELNGMIVVMMHQPTQVVEAAEAVLQDVKNGKVANTMEKVHVVDMAVLEL